MEMTLWLVVIVTLTLAISMAVVAWRLLRGDRQRTNARVTALRHMALDPSPDPDPRWDAHQVPDTPARHDADYLRWEEPPATAVPAAFSSVDRSVLHSSLLHSPVAPTRRWMPVMVVALFIVLGAGTVYGLYGPAGPSISALSHFSLGRGHAAPLELLSLSHRSDRGDFVVTGLIQNPAGGETATQVTAVVFVFNDQGEYFASGTSTLDFSPLAPGAESPFVVRIPKVSGVKRFRVGFRTGTGAVVAHVDRRDEPLEGLATAGGN